MKETGTDHWQSERSGTSNSSGFTARGSGFRLTNGTYGFLNQMSVFWTVSDASNSAAHYRAVSIYSGFVNGSSNNKKYGYSVRCLED